MAHPLDGYYIKCSRGFYAWTRTPFGKPYKNPRSPVWEEPTERIIPVPEIAVQFLALEDARQEIGNMDRFRWDDLCIAKGTGEEVERA